MKLYSYNRLSDYFFVIFLKNYGGETTKYWTVYILKCNDNSYYTGCTSDIIQRLNRHTKGYVKYTKSRLPVELILEIRFKDRYKAYDFEKYLKSGSGRAFANKRFL